jgi:hypothetical protein
MCANLARDRAFFSASTSTVIEVGQVLKPTQRSMLDETRHAWIATEHDVPSVAAPAPGLHAGPLGQVTLAANSRARSRQTRVDETQLSAKARVRNDRQPLQQPACAELLLCYGKISTKARALERPLRKRRTNGSNPVPSSRESLANLVFGWVLSKTPNDPLIFCPLTWFCGRRQQHEKR